MGKYYAWIDGIGECIAHKHWFCEYCVDVSCVDGYCVCGDSSSEYCTHEDCAYANDPCEQPSYFHDIDGSCVGGDRSLELCVDAGHNGELCGHEHASQRPGLDDVCVRGQLREHDPIRGHHHRIRHRHHLRNHLRIHHTPRHKRRPKGAPQPQRFWTFCLLYLNS